MAQRNTQRGVDELRRVLLPPLRFAQRDNYACVDRLGGFQQLVHTTLRRLAPDLPEPLTGELRRLGRDFDTLSRQARQARVRSFLTALQSPNVFCGTPDRLEDSPKTDRSGGGKHVPPAPASREAMNRVATTTEAAPAPPCHLDNRSPCHPDEPPPCHPECRDSDAKDPRLRGGDKPTDRGCGEILSHSVRQDDRKKLSPSASLDTFLEVPLRGNDKVGGHASNVGENEKVVTPAKAGVHVDLRFRVLPKSRDAIHRVSTTTNRQDDKAGDQGVRDAPATPAARNVLASNLPQGVASNLPQGVVQALQADGIRTARDVLHVLPKDCVVCRAVNRIEDLRAGAVRAVFGLVVSVQRARGKVPRVDVMVSVISSGDTVIGLLRLTFFRMPQSANWFQLGRRLTLVGQMSRYRGQWQMVHPRILSGDRREQADGVRVVYPTCAGVSPQTWEQIVAAALSHARQHPAADPVPEEVRQTCGLAALADAYTAVHEPPPADDALNWQRWCRKETPFHRRLAFEELLGLQIALSVVRNGSGNATNEQQNPAEAKAPALPPLTDAREVYRQFFPHEPTPCQLRVLAEIAADLGGPVPMTRLLHGDVGAGKTAVAAAGCLHVVRAGLQCALMAPTEVLAKQHERTLATLFAPLGIRVALVTNQLKGKPRKACCAALAAGQVHVAVGTHALLSDDIQFKRLGLCMIDEQHRFGVAQRGRLRGKGEKAGLTPHLLVMTATPIPRSLALVLYGNMRVSTLRSLPAGRQPIATRLLRGEPEAVVRELTALLRRAHRKAYVVYPLIDESEKVDLADAKRGCKALQARLGEENVLLLHSRLSGAQRQEVMERFAQGTARVLVATTVVEVGVDVPEATCMVIVHAERFGLSQLHQLRGRVGRGATASECLLVAPKHVSDTAYERLKVLTETTDGFRIAEADLAARGPGDFVGKRQSGAPLLRCCDLLRHADLIEPARRVAADILRRDPQLTEPAHAPYRQTAAWQTLS